MSGLNKGVVLVGEFPRNVNAPWATFQGREEGAQLIKDANGNVGFAAFTYRFNNPEKILNPNVFDFIRAGDGRALLADGSWSMTTIDSKMWGYFTYTELSKPGSSRLLKYSLRQRSS